jgi:HEAT repeat protein
MRLLRGFLTTMRCSGKYIVNSDRLLSVTLDRHEVASVFGQMLSPHSVPALLQVLQNPHESDMVRHEAAEALGGIATSEVLPYLKEYMTREDAPISGKGELLDMYEVSLSSFS